MKVIDMAVHEVATITADKTICDCARQMRLEHVGSLVVVNDDQTPLGMITDRDIAIEVVARNLDPMKLTVRDVMTTPVVTAGPSESMVVALARMREFGVRRLPIHDFYIKAGKVDIRAEDGEIQTAVLIPKGSYENCFGHYIKYAMRNAMDIATLGTSVNVRLSADKKTVERARVAFGVAGPVPLRAATAEAMAKGQIVSLELAERFAQAVTADINPRDSWRAAKDFRLHIAVESAKRAFIESVKLAGGEL